VAHEQIGQPELAAELIEQAEHGRLHGKVETGSRLVEDHDTRAQDQNARQPHAPLLPARQLVRVAPAKRCV
jgi:hypothetical protein